MNHAAAGSSRRACDKADGARMDRRSASAPMCPRRPRGFGPAGGGAGEPKQEVAGAQGDVTQDFDLGVALVVAVGVDRDAVAIADRLSRRLERAVVSLMSPDLGQTGAARRFPGGGVCYMMPDI